MAIVSYSDVHYDAIYATFGVDAEMTLADATVVELTVIDKTAGVEVMENRVNVSTIRPAAAVMMDDLTTLELSPEDLIAAVIVFNGNTWIIKSYYPKPSPNGERDGELYLILEKPDA